MDNDRKINRYSNRPKMTNKHHTEMLVNDWRNNNHNCGKMEIGESIKGRIHKGFNTAAAKPNFHVIVIVPLKKMQHI